MELLVALLFYALFYFFLFRSWIKDQKYKPRRRRRKAPRYKKPRYTDNSTTVAYIIIKNGIGKFGITKKGNLSQHAAVNRRYNNEPLRILWTCVFKSRAAGYDYERFCKTKVRIIEGREWFDARQAQGLVEICKNTFGGH